MDATLRAAELQDRADSGVLELSGGERQRLLLARALTQETPLLLLDEPTAHLDIGHELDLLGRVRRLVVDRGGAVVAAMHDLNLAARFADRVVVLSRGRQVDDGPPVRVRPRASCGRCGGSARSCVRIHGPGTRTSSLDSRRTRRARPPAGSAGRSTSSAGVGRRPR